MKYTGTILFALLLATTAVSAQSNTLRKKKTDLETSGFKGKVKEFTQIVYNAEEKAGKIIQGTVRYWSIYKYNEQGNVILITENTPKGKFDYSTAYVYDQKGNLIETKTLNADKTTSMGTYTYDDKGQLIEDNSYGEKRIRKYDEKGNMTELNLDKGWMKLRLTYKYDDKGNTTERTSYNEAAMTDRYTFAYDDRGNITEENEYGPGDTLQKKKIKKYDDKNSVVQEQVYDGKGTLLNNYTHTLSYDANGKMVSDTQWDSVDMMKMELYNLKYTYDPQGNWTKQSGKSISEYGIITRAFKYY